MIRDSRTFACFLLGVLAPVLVLFAPWWTVLAVALACIPWRAGLSQTEEIMREIVEWREQRKLELSLKD
jgi:hypothetical protein